MQNHKNVLFEIYVPVQMSSLTQNLNSFKPEITWTVHTYQTLEKNLHRARIFGHNNHYKLKEYW